MNAVKSLISLAVLTSISLTGAVSYASSFQSNEQSATLNGQADAGSAVTDDPSIQFFNPAGMSFVKGPEIGLSSMFVQTRSDMQVSTATDLRGNPINGTSYLRPNVSLLPGFYFIYPANDKVAFGIGMSVPFGLETKYPANSLARYFATDSELQSININPAVSIKINPKFSVGGGLNINWAKATLNQAFDLGSFARTPDGSVGDVQIQSNAQGWAFGWNVGVMLVPDDKTKVGLSWRSRIDHQLSGGTRIIGLGEGLTPAQMANQIFLAGALQNSRNSADLVFPGYGTLSVSHKMTPKWTVMGDVEYIHWSDLKSVTLRFQGDDPSSASLPAETIDFNYKNTWRVAVGQSYQVTKKLLLRMGLAYDQTPIPSDDLRTARLPSKSRYWLSVGGTYDITKQCSVSLAYTRVFIQNLTVNQSRISPLPGNPVERFVANYTGGANLFGAQINYRFS